MSGAGTRLSTSSRAIETRSLIILSGWKFCLEGEIHTCGYDLEGLDGSTNPTESCRGEVPNGHRGDRKDLDQAPFCWFFRNCRRVPVLSQAGWREAGSPDGQACEPGQDEEDVMMKPRMNERKHLPSLWRDTSTMASNTLPDLAGAAHSLARIPSIDVLVFIVSAVPWSSESCIVSCPYVSMQR